MACPNCDHTMQCVAPGVFWCPRCGTLNNERAFDALATPWLVERCREFERTELPAMHPWSMAVTEWLRLGINESINVPENWKTFRGSVMPSAVAAQSGGQQLIPEDDEAP